MPEVDVHSLGPWPRHSHAGIATARLQASKLQAQALRQKGGIALGDPSMSYKPPFGAIVIA